MLNPNITLVMLNQVNFLNYDMFFFRFCINVQGFSLYIRVLNLGAPPLHGAIPYLEEMNEIQ